MTPIRDTSRAAGDHVLRILEERLEAKVCSPRIASLTPEEAWGASIAEMQTLIAVLKDQIARGDFTPGLREECSNDAA